MFFPFFVSDGHLCFSLIFFVILLAAQGSLCASTHVHQPSDGVGSWGGMGEETRPGETCERGRLSVVSGGRMQRQKVKNRESDGTLSFSPPRSATASANWRGSFAGGASASGEIDAAPDDNDAAAVASVDNPMAILARRWMSSVMPALFGGFGGMDWGGGDPAVAGGPSEAAAATVEEEEEEEGGGGDDDGFRWMGGRNNQPKVSLRVGL